MAVEAGTAKSSLAGVAGLEVGIAAEAAGAEVGEMEVPALLALADVGGGAVAG